MCLLDRLDAWTDERIICSAIGHRDPRHPLRTRRGLLAPAAIEYAAQAMALHGALLAPAGRQAPGYLASVRGVRLAAARLDQVDGRLIVRAERLAGSERQILYRFRVSGADDIELADGRATVVLGAAT